MKKLSLVFALLCILATAPLRAQIPNDAHKDMAQIEKELQPIAQEILMGKDIERKAMLNKAFIQRMTAALQRPESYTYNFDSLKTISILRAPDDAFRIFTWFVADGNPEAIHGMDAYYYFGLVQRKYVTVKGETQYIVIPLMELEQLPKGVENMVMDNRAWFGALYYKPKMHDEILSYKGSYYKLVPIEENRDPQAPVKQQAITHYTFTPGKYRSRTLVTDSLPQLGSHKRVKENVDYYVLMGWNGWDNKSNYKVVDVMSFDPEDSSRVLFGAPIFYFEQVPKARALFKYSDFSSFTLNEGYVKRGPLGIFRKRMLVYDHMSPPNSSRPMDAYELGSDGSYDALSYFSRYGGYFEWYRQVKTADKYEARQHRKYILKKQMEAAMNDSLTFPDYAQEYKQRQKYLRRTFRQNQRELKAQSKAAEKKLKESGIELKRN